MPGVSDTLLMSYQVRFVRYGGNPIAPYALQVNGATIVSAYWNTSLNRHESAPVDEETYERIYRRVPEPWRPIFIALPTSDEQRLINELATAKTRIGELEDQVSALSLRLQHDGPSLEPAVLKDESLPLEQRKLEDMNHRELRAHAQILGIPGPYPVASDALRAIIEKARSAPAYKNEKRNV